MRGVRGGRRAPSRPKFAYNWGRVTIGMIDEVMDYRDSFYKMYKIDDKLLEANVHMVKCPSCSPSETAPNVPIEAHSVPSSAGTNTGVVNTGDGSGTGEANGSTENGNSSTIPEETTEATV